jgi:type VI protein secretion system component VasA
VKLILRRKPAGVVEGSLFAKTDSDIASSLRRGAQWRLLSHLLLNPLSIVEGLLARGALQEILMLYDFMDSAHAQADFRLAAHFEPPSGSSSWLSCGCVPGARDRDSD